MNGPNWKGGRRKFSRGYVGVWVDIDHPYYEMSFGRWGTGGYIYEHRLAMAYMLGRALRPGETVHHINGIKDDNEFSNLQLRTGHHGQGVVSVCLDCGGSNIREARI